MATPQPESQGDVSEWNEGNFKSMRLHQAQMLINNAKINPFSRNSNKWSYELWFSGIDIMYGEGQQKYSESEKKSCKELKAEVEELLKIRVCSPIKQNGKEGVSVSVVTWDQLKPKLEEFEYLVKTYNDKHGLSTKNVGTKGLF